MSTTTAEAIDPAKPSPRGVPIRFYLQRLSDDEVNTLGAIALAIEGCAPRLSVWLSNLVFDEEMRRVQVDCGTPLECDLPAIHTARWTNTDVAQGLFQASLWTYTVDTQALGEFFDRLNQFMVALAQVRLER